MEAVLHMADAARLQPPSGAPVKASSMRPEARDGGAPPLTLEALFRDHFEDVYRLVGRLLGPGAQRADVEDLTQQTFLAAHKALPNYRGEARPSTWLCGVAARTVMTQVRGWRRRRRMLEAIEREPPPEGPCDLEERVSSRAKLRRVWICLARMSAKKRVVYLLHEIEGMSGADIAEALEIPTSTVWTRLYHARRELLRGLSSKETD